MRNRNGAKWKAKRVEEVLLRHTDLHTAYVSLKTIITGLDIYNGEGNFPQMQIVKPASGIILAAIAISILGN
jgi:hypothetical protein